MSEFPAHEFIPGDFSRGLVLICDHARNTLPEEYGSLGLPESEFSRHIAFDIGAEGLLRGLARELGVPAVLATYSRLLIDPNRGEDDPTLIRQLYDGTIVPGNYPLSEEERQTRINTYYRPYHEAVAAAIEGCLSSGIVPAVFSVHTMTDRWAGRKRPWHAAILWDRDPRFAIPMLEELRRTGQHVIGDNEPYDGALAGDTLYRHCTRKGLANALLEIRQDLVGDGDGIEAWVGQLAPMIEKVNALEHIHECRDFGTRTGKTSYTD